MNFNSQASFLFITLCCIFSTGCSVHRGQAEPHMMVPPAEFMEAKGEKRPAEEISNWWERFKDPALNSIVEETLAHNLEITKAYARLAQLAAQTRTSKAARIPSLNLQGEASRDRQVSFLQETTGNNWRASLAAGYEIDLWRKIESRIDAATFEEQATREDIKTLYITLTAQAADLYFEIVEQRAQLGLIKEIIKSDEDTLKRVELRYREGLLKPLDVYQARQNIAITRARRPVFEKNLALASHALAVLMGRFPEKSLGGELQELPKPPPQVPPGIPAQLLTRRPDVRAAFLRLKAKDAQVAAAIADRFPSINLLGSIGQVGLEFTTGSTTGTFWNLIADLTLPLIDGGRRRAEVDRNKAAFEEEVADFRDTVLQAVQDVEDALARNAAAEERIKLLQEQADISNASLRLATIDYFEGVADYLPVLNNQVLFFQTMSTLLTEKKELLSARISLMRALGGDWMEEEMDSHLTQGNKQ